MRFVLTWNWKGHRQGSSPQDKRKELLELHGDLLVVCPSGGKGAASWSVGAFQPHECSCSGGKNGASGQE